MWGEDLNIVKLFDLLLVGGNWGSWDVNFKKEINVGGGWGVNFKNEISIGGDWGSNLKKEINVVDGDKLSNENKVVVVWGIFVND